MWLPLRSRESVHNNLNRVKNKNQCIYYPKIGTISSSVYTHFSGCGALCWLLSISSPGRYKNYSKEGATDFIANYCSALDRFDVEWNYFNFFCNNICTCTSSRIRLYSDYCVWYWRIRTNGTEFHWSTIWIVWQGGAEVEMALNEKKCVHMPVAKNKQI